ncbi:MAG TPA: ATP-binding cassette domain-containing protein [Candidatus Saccharimonadales bacterium]|nr:ATP-binding cassette domain-containing protein [Candidatus Saccharimonadales bacterium]
MAKAFEVRNLVKHFGNVHALDGVSLAAEEGTVFGLLGPNGAGKTTIVRILSTLLDPTSGTAKVHGLDTTQEPEKVREIIGLAGQYAAVDEFQTGYENVYMTGLLYGLKRREARKRSHDLIERLGLVEAADRQVKTYSGGMRRRLDLGASLVGQPKILFLDEPTTGLDPNSRKDIWAIVRELVVSGTSILLTTQYLEEADELAAQIAVVNEGKVIAEGTSDQLKARLGGDIIELQLEKVAQHEGALQAIGKFAKRPADFDETTATIHVPVTDGSKKLMAIVQALNDAKIRVGSLSLHRPSLDDVFLELTGQKTRPVNIKNAKAQGKRGSR